MNKIQAEYHQSWQNAYDNLNKEQKEAVDTIEGPVMVVAGPGTGKTQLLAVRVGKILLETDALAHNILCLTYTDAGVVAMQKRLVSLIGPDAYNVKISTFHTFCAGVIKDNSDQFVGFRELQTVSELEEVELLRQLLDTLPLDHPLKRLKGDLYNDVPRFKNLFSLMKQEKWSPEFIVEAYDAYIAYIEDPLTSPYVYKKNSVYGKKGELNQRDIEKDKAKYIKVAEAAKEYRRYNELLHNGDRYDFNDMILFVIDAFEKNPNLLLDYQERFQYILVDEYQDTNGSQNTILFQLSSYWENPNLFIVGDDDQSIYRFQGANMDSIEDFQKKFNPTVIVLKENYRNTQVILDMSYRFIQNNTDRLEDRNPLLNKKLIEKRPDPVIKPEPPKYVEFLNPIQQDIGVLNLVKTFVDQGSHYEDIAIIYRKHANAKNLIKYFLQNNIPTNVSHRANVLEETIFIKIFQILQYVSTEFRQPFSGDHVLFEIMHYEFFGISALDIARLSVYCRPKRQNDNTYSDGYKMRLVIQDKSALEAAQVKDADAFLAFSTIIEGWIQTLSQSISISVIENVISTSGIIEYVLKSEESAWQIQVINTFLEWAKDENMRRPHIPLDELLHTILLMQESRISIPIHRLISYKKGVNFMSAHSSKGLEFKHVIIMDIRKRMWEGMQGSNIKFSLPPTISAESQQGEIDDDRRLFYVAVTRAKDTIHMTYPAFNESEKEDIPSVFLHEFKHHDDLISSIDISNEEVVSYTSQIILSQPDISPIINHDLIDQKLENFRLSPSSLDKYLRCPLTFYFEQIVSVPMSDSKDITFGNAVHWAMEMYFNDIEKSHPRSIGSVQTFLKFFEKAMQYHKYHFDAKDFEYLNEFGKKALDAYYQQYHSQWLKPKNFITEYSIYQTEYMGVPITGKLDRINFYHDHVTVTDYKTGRFESKKVSPPKDINPLGGDNWRQIIFYKILSDADKRHSWSIDYGEVDYLLYDKPNSLYRIKIEPNDIEFVGQQIQNTYQDIISHQFTQGCGEESCKWCNFVKMNFN